MKTKSSIIGLTLFIILSSCNSSENKKIEIKITKADKITSDIYKEGRLFLFFSQNEGAEPRYQLFPDPVNAPLIYATNLSDFNSASELIMNQNDNWTSTTGYSLGKIPDGEYFIQALWDQDTLESGINAPGNIYSQKQKINIEAGTSFNFQLEKIIPERKLIEHELVKEINFKSDTLSTWWNRTMTLKASVLLPSQYDQSKTYPIRYNVAGYGGRYTRVQNLINDNDFMNWWNSDASPQIINVFLDGEGPFGDSYQMDSENSGPYGYALIFELIPHLEKLYRGTTSAKTRFVDGCSTGGWVSLGLQLYYPDQFNGAFSYSPDAIEFENYQLMNIYKDDNAFVNEFGYSRPCLRNIDGEPMVSMQKFARFENVLGRSNTYLDSGDQFGSHTALYSPKGKDGLPKPLFDAISGDIDTDVAEHWKKYDFKLYAEKNWDNLGPKLQGKIYIWMGDMDHFYLNMATRQFSEFLDTTQNPKSDAIVEFDPMAGHCSSFNHKRVLEQIQERLDEID